MISPAKHQELRATAATPAGDFVEIVLSISPTAESKKANVLALFRQVYVVEVQDGNDEKVVEVVKDNMNEMRPITQEKE